MTVTSLRVSGPAALPTSAATIYTATGNTVITRGRVSNPTGSVLTFTMSIGADSAGTRIYSSAPVPPHSGIDIRGPFSLATGDIIQASGSSSSLILELNGTLDAVASGSYHTTFAGTEDPISEGGAWRKDCVWFSSCQTGSGYVWGNQPQHAIGSQYQDSYALLNNGVGGGPYSPNQSARAIIKKINTLDYQEYELRLRSFDSTNACGGYEVFLHQSGLYLAVASWAGTTLSTYATGSYFDVIGSISNTTAPQDGDLFEAAIIGNIITVKLQGATLLTLDVTTGGRTPWTSGSPGIGFDAGNGGGETPTFNYGFQEFWADSLP